jgi:hypothetical protein
MTYGDAESSFERFVSLLGADSKCASFLEDHDTAHFDHARDLAKRPILPPGSPERERDSKWKDRWVKTACDRCGWPFIYNSAYIPGVGCPLCGTWFGIGRYRLAMDLEEFERERKRLEDLLAEVSATEDESIAILLGDRKC